MSQDQPAIDQAAPVAFSNFVTIFDLSGKEHTEDQKGQIKDAAILGAYVRLAFIVPAGATARMEHVPEEQRDHPHIKSGSQPVREIMWAKITKINEDGTYEGELGNDPVFVPIDDGHPVIFRQEHFLGILPPAPEVAEG